MSNEPQSEEQRLRVTIVRGMVKIAMLYQPLPDGDYEFVLAGASGYHVVDEKAGNSLMDEKPGPEPDETIREWHQRFRNEGKT